MSLGELIREHRIGLGITLTTAARLSGISPSYLSRIESDNCSPTPSMILRVTSALELSPSAWVEQYTVHEPRCIKLVEMANALFNQGEYKQAKNVLRRAYGLSRLASGQCHRDVVHVLARVYFSQERFAKALVWSRHFERLMRHSKDVRMQAIAQYNVGLTLAKLERYTESAPRLEDAAKKFGQLHLNYEMGSAMLHSANVLLAMRMYAQARAAYRHAAHLLRGKPFHDDALLGEAITVWMTQSANEALPLLRRIIDSGKTGPLVHAKAQSNLAATLRDLHRYDEALVQVEAALANRDTLPVELVAALLAEGALSNMLKRDSLAAQACIEDFGRLEGSKDNQDIAAMTVLADVLGAEAPDELTSDVLEDFHERRIATALRIMQADK